MFKTTKLAAGLLAACGGVLMSAGAYAQSQQLERVEITGSSIKRIDAETTAPITILRREDIERTGATSVEQLMRSVSAIVSSNSTAAASSSGATTGGISTISLRGLSGERTLILVNGKRTAPYGSPNSSVAVDVDSIPIAAIERVEILKDGASAIYGSDAIAGVVNFILRRDFKGVELSAGYGAAASDGKGDVTKLSGVFGFGDLATDKFNVMVQGTYQKDGALFGRDRDFAKTSIRLDKDNFGGSSRSEPGNINFARGDLDADGNPIRITRNPRVDKANGQIDCGARGSYVPEFNSNICLFDTAPFVGLIPETERYGVQLNGRVAVSEAIELYGEIGWTRKEAKTLIQPSPIDAAFGIPFTLTPASPFYPTAFVQAQTVDGSTPDLSVRYRPFIIGNRGLTDTADALRAVVGVQGVAQGWDYDASLLHTTSQVKEQLTSGYFRIQDDATGPGIVPLLSGAVQGSAGPLWLNPFGDNTGEVAAAARATTFSGQAFKTSTSLTSAQAKVSREVAQLDGGGMGIAIGGEVRREAYELNSADALATGNISGYGGNFVSIDTNRNVYGIFGEVIAPVRKGLELSGAVRYDRYAKTDNPLGTGVAASSLTGLESAPSGDTLPQSVIDDISAQSTGNSSSFSKATGKLGLRYQAMPELLLRSTLSTGFRAPALLDLYGPVQAGVSAVQNDPQKCQGAGVGDPNYCATQFNVYTGGNSQLKPEESTSFTVGFVSEPVSGFSVGLDFFNTEVKNLIATVDSTFILENESKYQGRVTRGASGEIIAIDQRLENTGKAKIQGFDFDVRGSWPSELGRFGISWSATYMTKWDSQNPDGSYTDEIGQTSGAVSGFIPRFRHSTTGSWSNAGWGFSATLNWQSSATDVCGNLLQDDFGNCPEGSLPKVPSYYTVDTQLLYSGFKGLDVAFGLRNLFDQKPPYVNGNGGAFQQGYDPTYVDPRGRVAYFTARYKF